MDDKEIRIKALELALQYAEIVVKGGEKVKTDKRDLCVLEIAEDFRKYIEDGTGKD